VFHSSAHDKRRHKRIDRLLAKKDKELKQICKKAAATPFFCRADAQAAADKLSSAAMKSGYHRIKTTIDERAKYGRGRPVKGKPRVPKGYEYLLKTKIIQDPDKIKPIRNEAGCFVLLTNLNSAGEHEKWDAQRLLRLYKDQSGVEQNFGFLKDPAVVNSIFLKKATRIEVLGLILLISLLIWRLMERSMRQYVKDGKRTLPGWAKRQTTRPTSFMMTTKFITVLAVKSGKHRQLAKPLKPVHLKYLDALNVSPEIFSIP